MRVLCLGSLNLDHVYKVHHIVRPGETISCESLHDFCGGKGLNQSIALARAGAEVYHAGKVGTDGEVLLQRLREAGVNVDYTKVEQGVPTGHAIIQVDANGQNSIVIAGGANVAITEADIDEILRRFGEGDLLLLQNETNNIAYAIQKAHEKGMQVALNPSPIDSELASMPALQYVDCFIMNEIEGNALTGEKEGNAICKAMHEKYPGCKVMLTLGEMGCIYHDGKATYSHGIYAVQAVDTTAAGDTFTGYFLACMGEGLPIKKVLELSSKASALAVSRAGASDSIPWRKEVEVSGIQPKAC